MSVTALPPLPLDRASPATRLLEKRRQMFEVQEALDSQAEESRRRELVFKQREEALRTKDRELQESLIKFNRFLQDNDAKRHRAEKKEREAHRQRVAREEEIAQLSSTLHEEQAKRAERDGELRTMARYSAFMQAFQRAQTEFPEIDDVLSRYDTLRAAHDHLVTRSREADAKVEGSRSQLQAVVRETSNEVWPLILAQYLPNSCSAPRSSPPAPRPIPCPQVLACNNRIAELQHASDSAVSESLAASASAEHECAALVDRKLQAGQVVMACEYIYERCADRSAVRQAKAKRAAAPDPLAEASVSDLLRKLNFIRDFALDLTEIVQEGRSTADSAGGAPDISNAAATAKVSSAPASPTKTGKTGGGGGGGGGGGTSGGGGHSLSAAVDSSVSAVSASRGVP